MNFSIIFSLNFELQIWTHINNTIIALFPQLNDEKASIACDEQLHQLLESLLCRFNTLNLLVPSLTNDPISKEVQQSYKGIT